MVKYLRFKLHSNIYVYGFREDGSGWLIYASSPDAGDMKPPPGSYKRWASYATMYPTSEEELALLYLGGELITGDIFA